MVELATILRVISAVVPLSLLLFILRQKLRTRRSPWTLQGKVVIITGASSGLGAACAKLFHSLGCRLILCGRNLDALEKVAASFEGNSIIYCHKPKCIALDLSDLNSIPSVADAILNVHGTVDILINNAGISYRGQIVNTDLDVDMKLMTVNYFGQVALTKALLPHLLQKDEGLDSHVVAISSVQGKLTIPFRSAYAASKHALQSFCDCLRAETAGSCLSVHVVSPGYIKTNLSVNALTGDGSTYGVLDETTAGGASPDDVADVVMETILRGDQDVVMAPLHNKLAIVLSSVLPNLFSKLMKRRALKFLKHKNKTD